MPLNFNPAATISPDAIKRMLLTGGNPSSMFNGDPSQPPVAAPGAQPTPPPSGTLAASMSPAAPTPPPTPEPATPSGTISAALTPPPSKADYLAGNPVATPARPRGPFDKIPDGQPGADTWGNRHNDVRHGLAAVFAGMQEFGRPGQGFDTVNRWEQQEQAKRDYDAKQPVMKQEAENQQYSTALGQGVQAAEIGKSHAETGLVGAQTGNLAMNPPGKAEFLKELQQRRSTGADDPQKLFNEYAVRAPYAHATRQEILDVIKNTPVKPFNFEVKDGAIQPGNYLGGSYGPTASPDEPPEIQTARNNAMGTIKQGQKGKIDVATAEGKARAAIQAGSFGQQGDPMVDMVGQGRVDLQTALQRVPPQAKDAFMTSLNAKYPGYSQSTYGIAKNVGEAFTAGDQGKQLTAISTAREHMKTFSQLADALDNNDVQALNRVGNAFGVQFGNDKATNFKIAAQAFGGEVGKAFDGAGVTEGERKSAQGAFNPNMSPQQFRGAIKTVDSLLAGKQKSLKESYQSGSQGKPNFGEQQPGGAKSSASDPLGIR